MRDSMQDAVFAFGRWYLYCIIVVALQMAQMVAGIQTFSLEEAFYRTSLYEENYVLPMHYILTRDSGGSIPLPIPEMPKHLARGSIDYNNEFKRKSVMVRDRYRYVNPKEVAFQTSFKVPLAFLVSTHTQFYFGYTSRSWWQCYTGKSAFFREIEQKADFFIEQPFFANSARHSRTNLHLEKLKIGFLHHSNGEGWEFEHSWNRVYIALFLKWIIGNNKWGLVIKRWHVLDTPDKYNYNPDIEEYLGNSELILNCEGRWLQWTIRQHAQSTQCLLSFPFSRSLRGVIYYFNGYGSTIGLYKTPCHSIGIGFQAKY